MKARIDYTNVPEALRGMYQLEHYIHNSGLEESLVHLVKMRASQINGCAYLLLSVGDQALQFHTQSIALLADHDAAVQRHYGHAVHFAVRHLQSHVCFLLIGK